MSVFPPPTGELAAASLLAFCRYPDGTLRDGVIYHCMPLEKKEAALKLGWYCLKHSVGGGVNWSVGLYAWLCKCKLVLPL